MDCLDDPECLRHFDTARKLSDASQLFAALQSYQKAYQRRPSSWLLINIGRMQQKLGQTSDAIVTYRRFLENADNEQLQRVEVAREYLKQAEMDLLMQKEKERQAVEEKKPAYKKWWFWVAVGGAAAAAAAITAGIVVSTRSDPSRERAANHFEFTF